MKASRLVRTVTISTENINQRNQRLGDCLVRLDHRTIPRDELTPSGVQRIHGKLPK